MPQLLITSKPHLTIRNNNEFRPKDFFCNYLLLVALSSYLDSINELSVNYTSNTQALTPQTLSIITGRLALALDLYNMIDKQNK